MPSSLSTPGYGVRSGALMGWRPLVDSLGGEPLALLRDHGLSPDLLGDPDAIMPVARFAALLGGCARHLRCPDFGLCMADGQGMAMLGALGKLIQDSPGPEAGLAVLQRHIALHNQGEYWSSQVTAGRLYVYRFELFDDDLDRRVYRELSVGACLRLIQELIGRDIKPSRVALSHRPLAAPARYRRFFAAPVSFNEEQDVLVFDAAILRRRLVPASDALNRYLDGYIQRLIRETGDDLARQVRALISQTLPAGRHDLEHIATLLGLHPRTLQRRLRGQGAGFNTLLTETRMAAARWHLAASTIPVTLLAGLLGYANVNAFSRAFLRVHGCPPRRWRRDHAVVGPGRRDAGAML